MEKQGNSKKKTIFKLLPKAAAAAAFIFQHAPFSPGRERKLTANQLHHKGFAGSIIQIPSNLSSGRKSEPSSPKISCMGQIKHNKKIKSFKYSSSMKTSTQNNQQKHVKKSSVSKNIFSSTKLKLLPGRKSDVSVENNISRIPDRAPCLSQMKRFASGREPLTNFDWKTIQITPQDNRKYYSDEDTGYSDDEEEEKQQEFINFSNPILIRSRTTSTISLEPRKEINLWKRRTMNQPKPLQVKTVG